MTSWDANATKSSKALYATKDGGATWAMVMQNEQYNPNLPNNTIPMAGIVTGMIFKNTTHGLVTLQTGALPKIYMTSDSGVTWHPGQEILVNAEWGGCDKVITGEPEFSETVPPAFSRQPVRQTSKTASLITATLQLTAVTTGNLLILC